MTTKPRQSKQPQFNIIRHEEGNGRYPSTKVSKWTFDVMPEKMYVLFMTLV